MDMSEIIREHLYLTERFPTREALDEAISRLLAPDATSSQWIADCPRRAEYAIRRGIIQKGEALPLMAGFSLHAGEAVYYTNYNTESALQALRETWEHDSSWRVPPAHQYAHLHLGHLEVILKNYFKFAALRDTFKPITIRLEDLNLEKVVGAEFRVTNDDRVVLGESKLLMSFEVNGEEFLYAGIPDLPIELGGLFYVLDHKSTNSYLSDWWFSQFRFSNQLRGYCKMMEEVTGIKFSGALINGIYMGEKASSPDFGGQRFARYGPLMFQPGHLDEAIRNQYYWRKSLDFWEQQGYYPQHASKLCGGCPFAPLCDSTPAIRNVVIEQEYTLNPRRFLDI